VPRNYFKACWITSRDKIHLESFRRAKANYLAVDKDDILVFLAETTFLLSMAEQDYPEITFHKSSEFMLEL
jgi:peptide chain release factor 3